MSEYYDSLNIQAKARYEEKLKLAGLSLEEDPYNERNGNKYKDDMTAWPPLEYGHTTRVLYARTTHSVEAA